MKRYQYFWGLETCNNFDVLIAVVNVLNEFYLEVSNEPVQERHTKPSRQCDMSGVELDYLSSALAGRQEAEGCWSCDSIDRDPDSLFCPACGVITPIDSKQSHHALMSV